MVSPETSATGGFPRRRIVAIVVALVILGFGFEFIRDAAASEQAPDAASYVGSETCAGCHPAQAKLWDSSQHKAAMAHATEKTVLGDFNDASFDYFDVHSRFFRKDGKFWVETDGPDGKLAVFEVKYTFGVDPLQQYLVEFPDGRLQVLALSWDSRPKDAGGQRWFHVYPDEEIKHDDVLHWTRLNQNWNFMCAECHSTGLRKHYDATTDRFATVWAEISVGCETCHGQGSWHAAWARDRQDVPSGKPGDSDKGLLVTFDERRDVAWPIDPKTGTSRRSLAPAALRKEVETCRLCHARRAGFNKDWVPGRSLSQTHVVEPLARNTYHADGQIRDVEEPYNYTPFRQSAMFAAGVTCSDCHEPHSSKLRFSGDAVCVQCHASEKFADARHRHHADVNPPPAYISCHMQARIYMVVDPRHDHSFRVPRPDTSVKLGTPNACNGCHTDKPASWAAAVVEQWFGPVRQGFQNYASAFHAARTDAADAATLLAAVAVDGKAPAIARASALAELALRVSPANIGAARAGLTDPDPMVRIGALDMLENLPAGPIWPWVSPLLADPVRGVRFAAAAEEFVAAQRSNAERPEARTTLGNFFRLRGFTAEAEAEYQAALKLSPHYPTAAINLADLYRQPGRDGDGEALAEFSRASELEPADPRYQYVYAVALHSAGRSSEAIALLKQQSHPANPDILTALISFNRLAGDLTAALNYAEQLAAITPGDRGLAMLIETLRQAKKPQAE